MALRLSEEQLAKYDRDGALFPIPVLSMDEVVMYRNSFQALMNEHSLRRVDGLHKFFKWAYRLVTQDSIVDAVESILGSEILLDATVVFCKPAHDNAYVSWHQDSVYSGWHRTPSTSAWIALSASHPGNGCMRMIPESHKEGLLDHINVEDDENLLRRGENIDIDVDESRAANIVLRPGEMSLHQSNIIHGSNPNTSDEARIGFIARYVTNQIERRDWPLMRIRGVGDCSHLKMAEPPIKTTHQVALANWRKSTTV